MALETATHITDLVATNPVGASDNASVGDDHIRLIKSVLLTDFAAIAGAVTATHTELNYADGVTSNIQTQLDGKLAAYFPQTVKTDNFTAAASNHYILRTNSSKTVTFPASPTAGDTIWITNTSGGNWSTDRNSKPIMATAADDTISNGAHWEYTYFDGTTGWVRVKAS